MGRIVGYRPAERAVAEPVTKFGGQPVWLELPRWPLSAAWGTPMRFVGQITLEAKLAYLFVTAADDADDFDPDVIFPDGGENAVIIQPGGAYDGTTVEAATGPTVSHEEYLVEEDDAADDQDDDRIGQGGPVTLREEPGGGPWGLLLRLATNWTPFHLNLGAAPVLIALIDADGCRGCMLVEDS
ncbi:hypothetical protein KZZ52_22770 [Dactylosporangium sp. AC04546]|uniref:hypothetical protein n=1 Tax=Dactylosporangium sp. AC04546 TaxID=2862460 RepID=UPI001EDF8E71|nr:hypothetical protein [Dactylosporangium sp. AC04546]WVK88102.1 hypothetical protein KZZ52_22770 [Dactylosporangium sp. AC04546]